MQGFHQIDFTLRGLIYVVFSTNVEVDGIASGAEGRVGGRYGSVRELRAELVEAREHEPVFATLRVALFGLLHVFRALSFAPAEVLAIPLWDGGSKPDATLWTEDFIFFSVRLLGVGLAN